MILETSTIDSAILCEIKEGRKVSCAKRFCLADLLGSQYFSIYLKYYMPPVLLKIVKIW